MRKLCLMFSFCIIFFAQAYNQNWAQMNKVVANERNVTDRFGFSVDLSGNYAIIGSHLEDEDQNGNNTLPDAGAAFIFKREQCSWTMLQKIVAADRKAGSQFGTQVVMDGDYAFIGAYLEDEDENGNNPFLDAGAVYIFKNINGSWSQVQKIVAPDRAPEDFFGYSLAVDGNQLVIGAYREDEDANGFNSFSAAGSVYYFQNLAGTWTFKQKLVSNDRGSGDNFGFSLDIEGNNIIIGAINDQEDVNGLNPIEFAGSAYHFIYNGNQWLQNQKMVNYERVRFNQYGYNVKLQGNSAFFGTPNESRDENGSQNLNRAGAVYVLNYNGGAWLFNQKLVAPVRATQDFFGNAVSISSDQLLISAYREDEDSTETNTLADAGSAYLFKKVAGNWSFEQKLCPADRGIGDFFSLRLDIEGDYILIGSSLDDEDVSGENTMSNSGSAYFFRNLDGNPCDVYDACMAIDALIQSINSSSIPAGTKASLIAKLQSAKSSFQNGQINTAINKLNAFINEVQAQSGKKIPTELANSWIAETLEIIAAMESGEAVCGEENEDLKKNKQLLHKDSQLSDVSIDVQPNPTNSHMIISSNVEDPAHVYLTDVLGRVVYHRQFKEASKTFEIHDIKDLSLNAGYYELLLVMPNHRAHKRILISN